MYRTTSSGYVKMFVCLNVILATLAVIGIVPVNTIPAEPNCIINQFAQVPLVVSTCTNIIISNLTVPSGETLELNLKTGSTVTFEGISTFGHYIWEGPLIRVTGKRITVRGAPGSVLDGQGALYWDGVGDYGPSKPFFIRIEASENSVFENINLLNCPHHCTIIANSDRVRLSGWFIDCSIGDKDKKGKNTDGFDIISSSSNIIIENSTVLNQDDCIAVNQGSNMLFRNLYCSGTHGLSLSVGFSQTSFYENSVSNITFTNSTVVKSENGIHIKTHTDGGYGFIDNITYSNIQFLDIGNYGINVQQDYKNGSGTGITRSNIPITNLFLTNVTGTMANYSSANMPVYIYCGANACHNFFWSGVNILGGSNHSFCNYKPSGYICS